MNNLDVNVLERTMSSQEIAKLTDKRHDHVLRDIRSQLYTGLYGHNLDNPNLGYPIIQGLTVVIDEQTKRTKEILLNKYHTDILISGYEVKYRAAIVKRWHELETEQPKIVDPKLAALVESLIRLDKVEQEQLRITQEQNKIRDDQEHLLDNQEYITHRLDQIETSTVHFTVIGWAKLSGKRIPTREQAASMGRQAAKECKTRGLEMGKTPDPRFGTVHTYPKFILDELFLEV